MVQLGPLTRTLRTRLVEGAAEGGGWPYYAGQAPRLEPTLWALLALGSSSGTTAATERERDVIRRGWDWLIGLQRDDGLLVEPDIPVVNFGWNGLALIAAQAPASGHGNSSGSAIIPRLTAALVAAKGLKLEGDRAAVRLDSSLQAWPWVENTFSWIEPTAYCLIGLKRAKPRSAAASLRITEGEAVMLDRVCEGGGWNYGNANVLSQDLRPYVPTTALALLAMHDKRGHQAVGLSERWLLQHATAERSAMALSLAAISLRVYDGANDAALQGLVEQEQRTRFLGNHHLTAMALYAMTVQEHRASAFTVPVPTP
jgi:hypothetical protein